MSGAGRGPIKLPRGILPDGITLPPGTDIMEFCRALAESGADFAEQFDRNSATFHGGNTTEVPLGGARVPDSMGGDVAADWRALPDAPVSIEDDFGPQYNAAMAAHKKLGDCKKAISVLNKPVEMAMKLRVQYKDADGDDKTAWESRLKGAENDRDGALHAATETIVHMDKADVSDRTRECVEAVVERGKFKFEDKETFGEYMQVLQRANQAIFMDQKKLLQRMKDAKKAYKAQAEAAADAARAGPDAASAPPDTAADTSAAAQEGGA